MNASDTSTTEFDSLLPAARLDRRGFVTTVAATGFALAVCPIQASTVISTDSTGLDTGTATVESGGEQLPVYFARPARGDGLPVVLVVQEIFGVHEHIRDVCRRLAGQGYLAIAPELYFRQGDPAALENIADILSSIVSKVPDAQVMADLDACARWAATRGGDTARLAITGFCWGGRITWLYAAHNPALKAGVAWYGRLRGASSENQPTHPIDVAANLNAPVLGLYGGQDQGIPLDDVEAMRGAIRSAGKPGEIVVYPDAPHAFHADYRPSYRKNEAEDGWKRLLAWFSAHV
ncbi:dienelactone hydrolase family protein [Thauera linaloolentis]|uniref:Carboxymethylenebutenolidase n=1 Tax=Thauera linaloolentis (strain DSM 12138 / JCM 21573 / CCUG 41526 / CIP 105981 / IAM 15112 / NBRC 102519 / 47Lol) TaxID=1123367 RepID=N6ZBT7_THAL4|nr:dienelactone hydrolase family protein [Thauera linaloolentis]ENO89659.1 carboxymethylenebutenolidase [Thauera linaloolentis 47Lol = DSM 12138]MCM8567139.1 dienelactone hydrolase family protein [Thauera linaloolentis]